MTRPDYASLYVQVQGRGRKVCVTVATPRLADGTRERESELGVETRDGTFTCATSSDTRSLYNNTESTSTVKC